MRRREFLARTAALAGAAGLATTLPAEALLGGAARVQSRAGRLPSPGAMPIDTFVVLMMENRSFDHYFGWHPRADAVNAGLSFPDAEGNPVPTHYLPPDFQGCAFRDPDHSWDGGRYQWGRGKMEGFVRGNAEGTGSDEYAAGYYLKRDLGFIPHVADAFQLHDRFFNSLMASTYPNRHYMWSAQSGGQKNNVIPSDTLGNQWETIFDRALAKGVTATYYNSDLPFAALYGSRGLSWTRPIADYYTQAASGTLPNICFVDPPFADGGGGDRLSGDEHPHGDIRIGQAFMSDAVHAFLESPQFRRGALFIVYDEWGGFFEHVPPRFVPDDRQSRRLSENFGLSGFRIPAVVVSPFVKRGRVSHATCMFESILKLISYRFRLGHLTRRHRYAFNIGRTFDWQRPSFDLPDLPDPVAISGGPCSQQGGAAESRARRKKPHDLMLLESSGYLRRLGYEYRPATLDRIFREPDSVSKALRASYRRALAANRDQESAAGRPAARRRRRIALDPLTRVHFMRGAAGHCVDARCVDQAEGGTDSMSRKLIAVLAVLSAFALAAPAVAPAAKGGGQGGAKAKRVNPRAVATKECTQQLQQMGAATFKHTYGSLQGCVSEIIDEARIAVAEAIEQCAGTGKKARGKCIFRTALAILQELLSTPPPPPPPPPPPLSCPIDLNSVEPGLADLDFPDLSGATLSPQLAQQVANFQALRQELQELIALLAGQTGPIADMLRDQLAFVEQQLRTIMPDLEAALNAELCPAG